MPGGGAETVDLSLAFHGSVTDYAAASSDTNVATVVVSGATLTVSPLDPGVATIEVTARNTARTARQSFDVTVVSVPEAVGALPSLELVVGAAAVTVDVSQAFRGGPATYAASSTNPHVATVAVSGATLRVRPVREGETAIEVTARNVAGTASQSFVVRVITDPAEARALEALLAAFGRSILASVTTAVKGRFEATPGVSALSVAGRRLPVGTGAAEQPSAVVTAPWSFPVSAGPTPDAPLHAARTARTLPALIPGGVRSGRVAGDDLLRGSHFMLALDPAEPTEDTARVRWTVWGGGDLQSFAGEPGQGTGYDGAVRAGHVGVDVGGSRWLAGAFVSRSVGRADYRFRGITSGSGHLDTALISVQPYFRWAPSRGTEIWTILGAGSGTVESTRSYVQGPAGSSDLWMSLGVIGGRQHLVSVARFDLALRGDVGVIQLGTRDGGEGIPGLTASAHRYRLGIEAARTVRWASGASLTPFVQVDGRHDGGDGQTGTGLEVAGGVRLAHSRSAFGLEARGRVLALHAAPGYTERGMSVTALLTPGGADGRGLSLAVTPGWGAPAGGTDALWGERTLGSGRMPTLREESASLDARVGYGFAVRAGRLLTPFGEVGVYGPEYRRMRVGARLVSPAGNAIPLDLELAGERIEAGWGAADHRLALLGTTAF